MEGHARMLEQYANLEEKHIHLLAKHRRIHEGIDDVKKVTSTTGAQEFSRQLGAIWYIEHDYFHSLCCFKSFSCSFLYLSSNFSASLLWILAAFSIRHQDASTSATFRASAALFATSLTAIFSLSTLE
ncbi:KINESIN-LIKE PROTEIN KIN-12A-RELATED [Salix purpurea]|uniref:KINESIN-LIKE PROTEIN KIN-12A-RELATED n=1 Tax=Salix purpurea TaxID=77065 RepID=A0A9Q0Q2C3_SALPP|nr:KINESIN-LIKE PROTEIN KIN-12A-RELATED [Salix purpurea]